MPTGRSFPSAPAPADRPHRVRLLALAGVAVLALAGFLVAAPSGTARAADSVRVMPLGDSITGSPGCWRQLLSSRLQSGGYADVDFVGTLDNSTSCGTAYDGDNEGHGGFLATEILRQNLLPGWLSASRPDVVMVQLATNDVWSNISTGSILTTFSGLVDQMRAANPNVRVVVAQILPMSPAGCADCGQRVIALNDAIPAWAAATSTASSPVTVVDTWTGFSTTTDTDDGVHPNASGNRKLAAAWYPALTAAVASLGSSTPTAPSTPVTPTAPSTPVTPTATVTPTAVVTPTNTATPPNPGERTCSATFTLGSSWTGGFVGTVRVRPVGPSIASWRVTLNLPTGTTVTQVWNGRLSGNSVSAVDWNSALPAGGSTEFGFQGAGSPTGVSVASCIAA